MAAPEQPITKSLEPKLETKLIPLRVEKRAAPHHYPVAIGHDLDIPLAEEQSTESDEPFDQNQEKRAAQRFQFGLGKRAKTEQRFAFGLGKRNPYDNRFQFGLGKRATQRDNRFAFGLGKRQNEVDEYMKRRYSFGLGKRTASDAIADINADTRSASDESSDRR